MNLDIVQLAATYLLHFFFIFWIIVILCNQFFDLRKLKKKDHIDFIMGWKLFTPNPIAVDYKIFYRDIDSSNNITSLKAYTHKYKLLSHRRDQKAITEICNFIKKDCKKTSSSPSRELYYTTLFKAVMDYQINTNIKKRQIICIEYNSIINKHNTIFTITLINK